MHALPYDPERTCAVCGNPSPRKAVCGGCEAAERTAEVAAAATATAVATATATASAAYALGLKAGVALAQKYAEISTWDGWHVTAPNIDWATVDKNLTLQLEAAAAGKKP